MYTNPEVKSVIHSSCDKRKRSHQAMGSPAHESPCETVSMKWVNICLIHHNEMHYKLSKRNFFNKKYLNFQITITCMIEYMFTVCITCLCELFWTIWTYWMKLILYKCCYILNQNVTDKSDRLQTSKFMLNLPCHLQTYTIYWGRLSR